MGICGSNKNKKESSNTSNNKQPNNISNNKNHNDNINEKNEDETGPFDINKVRADALKAHNKYRDMHGCPPLKLDSDLNKVAQDYADKLASRDMFQHSNCKWNGKDIGENLAMCYGEEMTGQYMTQMWYDEIKDYDFKHGDFSSETGHFTQLIWKDSKNVGIGLAQSKQGSYYAVANYFPPGNIMGQFKTQVPAKV